MPIPNSRFHDESLRIEIFEEVLRGIVNKNSRYSFIKRSILNDIGHVSRNPAISVTTGCNGQENMANFIVKDRLFCDALIGTNFLSQFKITEN